MRSRGRRPAPRPSKWSRRGHCCHKASRCRTRATTLVRCCGIATRPGASRASDRLVIDDRSGAATWDEIIAAMRLSHADRMIDAEFTLTEPVSCDRSRLGQLLTNLLGNALTHGDVRSPVWVVG